MPSRWLSAGATAVSLGLVLALTGSGPVLAKVDPIAALTADLDGVPIKLEQVGQWYCDDFSYPAIHCFSSPVVLEARSAVFQLVSSVDFVTVYELGSFSGSYMHMSQDYTALLTIGWNDRISSLKGRNNVASRFFGDWFYGGAPYDVCCNVQITALGSFDNTFSSVRRT